MPINDTPRRVPRFLIPLINQTPRRRNTRIRGQVYITRQAGNINPIQLNHIYQIFQRARITHRPINIRHHQRIALTPAQRGQDLFPLRSHHPVPKRAIRQRDPLPFKRRHSILWDLPVNPPTDPRHLRAKVAELVVDLPLTVG